MKQMAIVFENLFREIILERGYSYHLQDLVSELEIGESRVTAIVHGSELYQVEIEIEGGEVTSMSCDCPYFSGGDNCKHLAAVFYALRQDDDKHCVKSDHDVTMELLESLTSEELISFLREEISINSDLHFKFKTKFQNKLVGEQDYTSYLRHIDSVFEFHLGRNNFIDYERVMDFEVEIGEIIEPISGLVDDGEYELGFIMVEHLVSRISELSIDDSWGTTSSIMGELAKILRVIIEGSSEPLYTQIFQWLSQNIYGQILDFLEEELVGIFMENYPETEKLQQKIQVIDVILADIEKESSESWGRKYNLAKWLRNKINILLELKDYKGATAIISENLHLSEVRNIAVDWHLTNNEYERAIGLLISGKKLYSDYRGIVDDYSKKLIEIYKLIGNQEAVVAESKRRLLQNPRDLQVYKDYRGLFSPKDWDKERDAILAELVETRRNMKPYYAEENMLEQLLAEIKEDPSYLSLDTYEDILFSSFTTELRDLFKARIISMAKHAGGRKYYKRINHELKRINRYPGGKHIVDKLLATWQQQYKNRPAMLEELGIPIHK